ncbi:DUF624 domain-containing protein [Paenibacillus sp. MWE-103]|uniref:DUF624 domain-containing protein n=1 Tax=Paenibacillus artemisiicola TaxID=1172618 RepID=A0ABS3WIX1_9BACL|nr:DUF624 domain-containing protein [Paenibacillus artemisiicola]MBO7748245.1 DUF624 domain-containing protein [Paenibacillus artemisiicola]
MEMKGMMGGFYKISEWIMRLSVTNILWLICSIPFVFVLLPILFAETTDQVTSNLIIAAVIAPFTLFPATAALFGVARKWVMGEVDAPLLRTFFKNYKESYVQAMLGGILYAVLFAILIVDFRVYLVKLGSMGIVSYLFVALIVLVGVSLLNFFSMLVHYHMKTLQLLKNALLITIGRPLRSLSTVVMCGVVLFISFSSPKLMFLVPFFTMSLVGVIAFWNFYGIYTKLQMQAEKAAEAEAEEERKRLEEDAAIMLPNTEDGRTTIK